MNESGASLRFWLADSEGQEREYEAAGIFELDGSNYMALVPVSEAEAEEPEVYLMGCHGDQEDRIVLEPIEDDEEYARAAQVFTDIFNEQIPLQEYYLNNGKEEGNYE